MTRNQRAAKQSAAKIEPETTPPTATPRHPGDFVEAPVDMHVDTPDTDATAAAAAAVGPDAAAAAGSPRAGARAARGTVPVSWPPQTPIGRIPVQDVRPSVDHGLRPAKSVRGEEFVISARVFREGHDAVNATVVLTDPDGAEHLLAMTCTNPGLNHWERVVAGDRTGRWSYRVEGWSDPYGTWHHDATIKIAAGVDQELMLEEGARVLERALADEPATGPRTPEQEGVLREAVAGLRDSSRSIEDRLWAGTRHEVEQEMAERPLRDHVTASPAQPWLVERELALTGAWYEFFPRSEGATWDEDELRWTTGTLRTAAERLPAIRAMGFDVIYLIPIHPIGTAARKGPNNTLNAGPDDPGSPYAIGSPDGGHDAIHPDLGTFEDFDHFVATATDLGLEVAMDLALQCSPDHPWVQSHPEWFTTRADGTIAYAENPPKKYQDIYPVNFDNDPAGIYHEVRRVIQVWIDHGVKIFRVDNPHTKPVEFWQWLIEDVAVDHPEVIWLAEAFTKPAMMHTLGKIGFQQSYTYYAWRNDRAGLEEYVTELAGDAAAYMRPSFWPTTHDILTPYMQFGGYAAWVVRAVLAATLVPTYGIYAGYELMEHVARPGAEEQIDNEKYQFKDRRWADYEPGGPKEGQSLSWLLTKLNEIRHNHGSLQWLRNIHFHNADDENVLSFSKRRRYPDGGEDIILVIANLDPHSTRETTVHLDMPALGFGWDDHFRAFDLFSEQEWDWAQHVFVRVGPETFPVHVVHVRRY